MQWVEEGGEMKIRTLLKKNGLHLQNRGAEDMDWMDVINQTAPSQRYDDQLKKPRTVISIDLIVEIIPIHILTVPQKNRVPASPKSNDSREEL